MITVPINGNPQVFEMFDEDDITFAEFYDYEETGYATLTLEQWGSDPNIRQICVEGYVNGDDISDNWQVDIRNEEEFCDAYAKAAELYNSICPPNEMISVIYEGGF